MNISKFSNEEVKIRKNIIDILNNNIKDVNVINMGKYSHDLPIIGIS